MIDPPRPNVPEAVSKCRSAGIKVRIQIIHMKYNAHLNTLVGDHGNWRSSNYSSSYC